MRDRFAAQTNTLCQTVGNMSIRYRAVQLPGKFGKKIHLTDAAVAADIVRLPDGRRIPSRQQAGIGNIAAVHGV
ncbi:MAG: hypothetical protein BWY71_01075 [Planctomycetes bacterium ADurb.Bin412]|nr:MAG: hypothetical protein BWY71_01075 [Planctomycetes bacterium ADurb.Bin412]